jgi:membrane-associated protease RseP (regulator of RpoE activity)
MSGSEPAQSRRSIGQADSEDISMNTNNLQRMLRSFGLAIAVVVMLLRIGGPLDAQQAADGAVQAGWIGISFVDDPDGGQAILVQEVVDEAPAHAAGIRAGDRIVRWNGRTDVAAAIRSADLRPAENVRVRVARAGETERDITITAAVRPPRYAVAPSRWGDVFVLPRDTIWRPDRVFVLPRDTIWRPDRVFALPRDTILRPPRIYRFDRDSLAIQMDSLNAQLRVMLRDSLGQNLRFQVLEPSRFYRDSTWVSLGQRLPATVRSFSADSLWALPGYRESPASLAIALATGRNAVAGAELTDITPGLSSYFGTEEGALILKVAPETPADRAGLRDGDVIVRVGDQSITGVAELRWALSRPGMSEYSLEIVRQGSRRTVTLGR